jgi:tetrahydromethanopterin S-methyltransferase subunit G
MGEQMPVYVTREEFETRMSVLEQEVEGEKMVTRHILEQTRLNSDDLAAIKTRLERVEKKVDEVDRKVDQKFDLLASKVDGLTKSLPMIVAETMREVLAERDLKR